MGPLISHSTNTGTNAVDFLFKQGEKTGSGRMRPYHVQLTVVKNKTTKTVGRGEGGFQYHKTFREAQGGG